ncbi:MAG: hypothetical protein ACK41D_06950, partial [Rubricoccaceae bacterium]
RARAHVHRVAEVRAEDTGFAEGYDRAPVPVLRLRYRVSAKNAPDLTRMLARFRHLRWLGETPPGETSLTAPEGDGAALRIVSPPAAR